MKRNIRAFLFGVGHPVWTLHYGLQRRSKSTGIHYADERIEKSMNFQSIRNYPFDQTTMLL